MINSSDNVSSIDEYDKISGKRIRTINFVLYKSIDEYDLKSGKKTRTINYRITDESKISTIQEYDIDTEKITTMYIFKRDGKTLSAVKKINPETGEIINWVNNSNTNYEPIEPAKFNTRPFDNIKSNLKNENIAYLIDRLYTKGFMSD